MPLDNTEEGIRPENRSYNFRPLPLRVEKDSPCAFCKCSIFPLYDTILVMRSDPAKRNPLSCANTIPHKLIVVKAQVVGVVSMDGYAVRFGYSLIGVFGV